MEFLQHAFLRQSLLAAAMAGMSLAFVGVYVLVRRIVFVGVALAQLGAAGIGLALWLGWSPPLVAGAAVLAGTLGFAILPPQERRVSRESLLGVAYALASALALLFVAKSPVGEAHMVSLLFGDLLAVSKTDLLVLSVTSGSVFLIHLIGYYAFVAVALDPTFAHSVGVKERWVNLLFYLSLGVLIGISIRVIGALVVFASLVLPPFAGLLWAKRIPTAFLIAMAIAFASAFLGLSASFRYDLPAGPSVVVTCGMLTGTVALVSLGWTMGKKRA